MIICPHCGKQINEKRNNMKKSRKHPKLPNGFGSITEIRSRKLTKPFYVRKCIGKDNNGRPILQSLKPVAYFKSYNEAYQALMEYNHDPFDITENITIKQLYDQWIKVACIGKSEKYVKDRNHEFSFLHNFYNVEIRSIKTKDIKQSIEEAYIYPKKGPDKGTKRFASDATKQKLKILWNMMFDYALEYDLVSKNFARNFELSKEISQNIENNKRAHLSFTDREIERLWANVELPYVDMILIQCYTGFRPNELLKIGVENINTIHWYIVGGSKTKHGKNRKVPVHSAIRPLVQKRYDLAKESHSLYLFNRKNSSKDEEPTCMPYTTYYKNFFKIMNVLKMDPGHRPHDPRKFFITQAKKYNMDENSLKIIVGHHINDITESIYTQRDIEWLRKDIEKIKVHK